MNINFNLNSFKCIKRYSCEAFWSELIYFVRKKISKAPTKAKIAPHFNQLLIFWVANHLFHFIFINLSVYCFLGKTLSKVANTIMKSNVSSTFVAWMVSHCKTHSERELFVKQLQQLVPVDIYGKCGPFKVVKDRGLQLFFVGHIFALNINNWKNTIHSFKTHACLLRKKCNMQAARCISRVHCRR